MKIGKRNIIAVVCLLLFCLVIISPPLLRGYVYPNIGTDTASLMNVLDRIGFFAPVLDYPPMPKILYGGIYIVGYPLDMISHIFNIDNDILFAWFNYLALMGMGISLFFIFKNLIGLYAGLLALLIPIFTSFSVLLLFYSGVIFNIINIGIVLPFACYYVIKYLMTKKKRFMARAICLSVLFSVFHSTGIYMPFIVIIGFMAYAICKMVKKQTIPKWSILGAVVVASGLAAVFIIVNPSMFFIRELLTMPSVGISGLPLLQEMAVRYMTPFVLIILFVSTIWLFGEYNKVLTIEKLTILVFGIVAVIMLPAILGLSPYPMRQGYDFAILASIMAVALVGVVIRIDKHRMITCLLVVVAITGGVININNWLGGYNSALEKVDIEAINYINNQPGEYYSCSDTIDSLIYSRYVNKVYLPLDEIDDEYYVMAICVYLHRNVSMKSKGAFAEDFEFDSEKLFLKKFTDGDIEIEVYRVDE